MVSKYLSIVYDLREFGISNISSAILFSEVDDGILIEVSFDGGKTFNTPELFKKFLVKSSTCKIQVRITFQNINLSNIYKIKNTGFFNNLEIGTILNFTNNKTSENYSTKIGLNGKYTILLPRGSYTIWVDDKTILMNNYNPETSIIPVTNGLNKETAIEMIMRDVDWMKYVVFDTFENEDKMIYGDAIVDQNGNLSDGYSDRTCKYWALGFNE